MRFAINCGASAKVHILNENQERGQIFKALCGFRPKLPWRHWHHALNHPEKTCLQCVTLMNTIESEDK